MIVRDSVFDVLLFGALALAVALELFFGARLNGVAVLLAVGLATYFASQELSRELSRRKIWTQESLATSVALSAMGFLYYFRNGADIILVALSLAFMMTSLMMLIAVVAALGAAWHERNAQPILGWLATFFGALALGAAAGVLVLVLVSELAWPLRLALLALGFALAKMRALKTSKTSSAKTPSATEAFSSVESSTRTEAPRQTQSADEARATVHAGGWTLAPERGTLLERFVPVLIVGALAFAFLSQTRRDANWPTSPAQASPAQTSAPPTSS